MSENWGKWVCFIILLLFIGIIAILCQNNSNRVRVETQLHEFKSIVHTKVLAELKTGPYLHRIIDEQLGKVCYLNATGGGIQCFSLKELTADMTAQEIKKLTKTYKKPNRYRY